MKIYIKIISAIKDLLEIEEQLLKMTPPSKRINQFKEESIPRKLMLRSDIEKKNIYNKKKSIVKFFSIITLCMQSLQLWKS